MHLFDEYFGCEGVRISGFEINTGPYVRGLKVFYEINGTQTSGSRYGTYSGTAGTVNVTLNSDEKIVGISGRAGLYIDQLLFETNQGRQLGPYGGLGGNPFVVQNCSEPRGIFGYHSHVINQLGFYCIV